MAGHSAPPTALRQGVLCFLQTGHETVKLFNLNFCSQQEHLMFCPGSLALMNNSPTAGEPFLRLNSVWKLLFSCQRARGNLFHPILPPTKSRERAAQLPTGLSDHSRGAERHPPPLAFCTRQENKPPY